MAVFDTAVGELYVNRIGAGKSPQVRFKLSLAHMLRRIGVLLLIMRWWLLLSALMFTRPGFVTIRVVKIPG